MNEGDIVSWVANKRSGALKHRAKGKIVEIDRANGRARVEMKVGPGGHMKNRFYKPLSELRVEDATRQAERQGEAGPAA